MRQNTIALLSGIILGAGLALSGMTSPLKVLAFLDITGKWDASLVFVMLAAILVTMPSYHWILKRPSPVLAPRFYLPNMKHLDIRLLSGASIFGVGWGLAGYCPGPAVANLAINWKEAVPFLLAVITGGFIADYLLNRE